MLRWYPVQLAAQLRDVFDLLRAPLLVELHESCSTAGPTVTRTA